jgi:divalent metal cation (Fe/Co/Zn/Cd) transporter
MGGLFALYEGIQKLIHPHESSSLEIAVGILIIAILLETYSLRTAVKEANRTKPKTMSWFRFIKTTKEPELPVVLLEDIGAEAGLFIALFGVVTAHFTHNARWDAAGSIAIGLLLIVIAVFLAIEMKSLLMGESALPDEQERITNALVADSSVQRIIHMRTMHLGPDEILVAAKIDFGAVLNAQDLARAIDAAEQRCRASTHSRLTIYIEPDISR